MLRSFVLREGGCSVVVVTFMSRELSNHVLCIVRHLVNRIVVFLESHVFSSLAKLLQGCAKTSQVGNFATSA